MFPPVEDNSCCAAKIAHSSAKVNVVTSGPSDDRAVVLEEIVADIKS